MYQFLITYLSPGLSAVVAFSVLLLLKTSTFVVLLKHVSTHAAAYSVCEPSPTQTPEEEPAFLPGDSNT